ncbi:MAG: heme exporter protein CcmD [Gammaproteobacteria bacterium]
MRDFLGMGGYALWVWSAFGLAAVVLVANVIGADRRYRNTRRRLRLRMNRAGSLRQ